MEHHADPQQTHDEYPNDAPAEEMPFSEEEVQMLHNQDMTAATYVVGLMLVIFGVGVIIYTIIAITAAA